MAETIVRAGLAVWSGGASELLRKKPFQPGGGSGNLLDSALGPYGIALKGGAKVVRDALTPKLPSLPTLTPPPTTSTPAVQQASSEAADRRAKSRGYRSTILSSLVGVGSNAGGSAPRETIGS